MCCGVRWVRVGALEHLGHDSVTLECRSQEGLGNRSRRRHMTIDKKACRLPKQEHHVRPLALTDCNG